MNENNICPKCGCTEIGQGKLSGYANILPAHKILSCGSIMIADICTQCGYIIEMRVKDPHKFK